MTWMHRIRLRALAWMAGIVLAAVAMVSLTAIPAWPVIGMAVAVAALTVNTITSRLGGAICLGCGKDLTGQPSGGHGVACNDCGTISPPRA
jgi:hypothetical protein